MILNFHLRNMNADKRKRFPAGRTRGRAVIAVLLCACALISFAGCGAGNSGADSGAQAETPAGGASGDGRISVVTTIFPPYDFVREIAGDKADVTMLLKPGEETHSYEPTPQDIIAIGECDVFIYTGGENDVWVEDILSSMPGSDMLTLRLVDCVDTVEEEYVEGMKESGGHSHGEHEDGESEEAEESVHEIDEHVWTSPVNASEIAGHIRDILIEADPKNSDIYAANTQAYQEELSELDSQFRQIVDSAKRHVLIFGDRFPFRYFADEYGIEYYAAFPGCAGDTEPSAAVMVYLIDKTKEEKVPGILKMELTNDDIAAAIAEATDTEVRVFYSCHNLSADDFENGETYLSMMRKNAETLKEVLN